jgi:hypothetical protein
MDNAALIYILQTVQYKTTLGGVSGLPRSPVKQNHGSNLHLFVEKY